MGVSMTGQRASASSVRHALATVLVFLGLFYYFYGPPMTQAFSRAAEERCNELTGESFRHYTLEWRTTTYHSLSVPHWECRDRREPRHAGWNLGWWVDL